MKFEVQTPHSRIKFSLILLLLLFCVAGAVTQADPSIQYGEGRIHYFRPDGNYSGWALYTWNASTENAVWCQSEVAIMGTDSFGVYFDVTVNPAQGTPVGDLGFIINNCAAGQIKDPGPDQHLQITQFNEAWVIHADATVFHTLPNPQQIANAILSIEQAYWLDRTHLAIQPQYIQSGATYALSTSLTGGLDLTSTGITGGTQIPLTAGGTRSPDELMRYPQLASYAVLQLPSTMDLGTVEQALKGEIALSVVGQSGTLLYATGIQTAGVLDDLYYYPGKLGVVFHENSYPVRIKVWAPTAQSVSLLLFDHASDTAPSATIPMQENNGVWVANGTSDWKGKYYLYSLNVWVPADAAVDTNATSDPYSIDIALNGAKSRITDLDSPQTKPPGWGQTASPPLRSFSDMSLYELHIRDFSVNDLTVPAAHRGTYEAFADRNSAGMRHLAALARSGLRAVHILPSFHIASINEDNS